MLNFSSTFDIELSFNLFKIDLSLVIFKIDVEIDVKDLDHLSKVLVSLRTSEFIENVSRI